ncbi:hypothetical protein H9P43_008928 [Blastocladiella emersonii ATCC 22665]|nr:hypothetical protein H9P43_008928 [Blastocladiella emersonii ATCC 22665]
MNHTTTNPRAASARKAMDDAMRWMHKQRHLSDLDSDNYAVARGAGASSAVAAADDPFGAFLASAVAGGASESAAVAGGSTSFADELVQAAAAGVLLPGGKPPRGRKRQQQQKSARVARVLQAKRTLASHIEESRLEYYPPDIPTYLTAVVGPSTRPARKLCSVCGFKAAYTCVKCGMLYCSLPCQGTHTETRYRV